MRLLPEVLPAALHLLAERSRRADPPLGRLRAMTRFKSYEDLIEAALEIRPQLGLRSAVLGGLAMQLYGSPRLTADVDFVSLSYKNLTGKDLRIGGIRTQASNGVDVDIIIREDDWSSLYIAAASNATTIDVARGQLPVVTREYMLSLKLAAGRPKDELDAKFLLVQPELDFNVALQIARDNLGRYGAQELKQLREISLWEHEREKKELK
jgi:hypothetical protein